MKKFLSFLFLFSVPLFCSGSGYALYEMNAAAHGMAHAYICRVDDASAVWYNPAALTRVDGTQLTVSTTWINTTSEFTPRLTGRLIDGVTENFFPTNFYLAHPLSDSVVMGVGVYNPFGLSTEWPGDSLAAFINKKAKLTTFFFTPSFGYKITPNLSIGGGIDFVFADVELQRNIDLRPALPVTIFNRIDGNGTDFGFNLGLLADTNKNWKFAVTYKHKIDVEFDGDVVFTGVPAPIRVLFPDGKADLSLPLPAQLMFGAATTYEKWSFEGDLVWTKWDALDEIPVNFAGNTPRLPDQVIKRKYDNGWSFRVGAEYAMTDHFALRAGYFHDKSGAPDQAVDPILPDASRNAFSFGFGWNNETLKVDVAFLKMLFESRTTPTNNFVSFPGNLLAAGVYEGSGNLLAIGFGYQF